MPYQFILDVYINSWGDESTSDCTSREIKSLAHSTETSDPRGKLVKHSICPNMDIDLVRWD